MAKGCLLEVTKQNEKMIEFLSQYWEHSTEDKMAEGRKTLIAGVRVSV